MDRDPLGDRCHGEVTLEGSGGASIKPEEVHQGRPDHGRNGDGRTFEDGAWDEAGTEFAARAGRFGHCGPLSARDDSVEVTATDECGNPASAVGLVSVEHDRQHKRTGRKLGPNDPPPWPSAHETTCGEGCGLLGPPHQSRKDPAPPRPPAREHPGPLALPQIER